MEPGAWGLLLVLAAVVVGADAGAGANAVCPRVVDSIPPLFFNPPISSCSAAAPPSVRVVEGDETALHKALNLVYKNKGEYVAILFYATWCPFSRICRPNFDLISSLFPAIRHFAFEDSVIRPSVLSKYGVHGFPTLFLLNSTMRVRYQGSRKVNSLISFYRNVTGTQPRSKASLGKSMNLIDDFEQEEDMDVENCPFSWARSPEKLFQQDTYLALATTFLLLRLLYILMPKLLACVNRAWRRHIRYASLLNLIQVFLGQAKHIFSRLNPYYKKHNLQDGTSNARAWASKSLASVSIAETSSARLHTVHEKI